MAYVRRLVLATDEGVAMSEGQATSRRPESEERCLSDTISQQQIVYHEGMPS